MPSSWSKAGLLPFALPLALLGLAGCAPDEHGDDAGVRAHADAPDAASAVAVEASAHRDGSAPSDGARPREAGASAETSLEGETGTPVRDAASASDARAGAVDASVADAPTASAAERCGVNPGLAKGRIQMENLCRGVVAVRTGSSNFVSWRLLGYEPEEIAFNVYRDGTKVNPAPLDKVTHFIDAAGSAGARYTVRAVLKGVEQSDSEQVATWPQNYLTIRLSAPSGYTAGDTSVGDLDGDGHYELVVKWESMPRDNSQAGVTGTPKLDAYELDGTRLWRIELGRNIREGAHYTQFIVYDFDGDGSAEVALKTAPGTRDGTDAPVVVGNDRDDADYRNADGYVLSGPEYLTVFSGRTGKNLATTRFEVARGNVSAWGDSYGNRVDRFLATLAFLDEGGRPSFVMARGYYTRSTLTAWNYRDGKLMRVWLADSDQGTAYAGQGAHSISVADVDGDGRQEIIYGASTLDDNGTRMCSTNQGHGDALHVSDFVPSRPGLEVFMPHEANDVVAYTMRDAKTCALLWQGPSNNGMEGPGRGVAADVDPTHPGAEAWVNNSSLLAAESGRELGARPPSSNFLVWWDGDLSRELLDGTTISNADGAPSDFRAEGCTAINGTKSTPNLSADLIGDFREEVILRCGNDLRLYTTTAPTQHRVYTLMHDPQYRAAVAFQNVGYNQPPHPSFHIGEGMAPPPRPDIHVK
jgi:rhamnogalacturonan endolyase